MLAAIRDASVGKGHRIHGALQAIQSGLLYSEFARVALFELEGTYGSSSMYAGGQDLKALNRFSFADLEDFDQSPVHSVKRSYSVVRYTNDARESIERFRGLEVGISDIEHRRNRLLSVDTSRLVESFGVNTMDVSSEHIVRRVKVDRVDRHVVRIYGKVASPDTRLETRGQSQDLEANNPMGIGVVVPDAPDEVQELGDVEVVLRYLRGRGLDHFASELEYKKILIEEDLDDLPINPDSARGFARFVASETLAGGPNVTVDADGFVGLEWVIPDPLAEASGERSPTSGRDDDHVWGKGHGVLGLWFLPDGMVRIYGTSGPVRQSVVRMRVNCTVTPSHVMNAIEPFMSRLGDV